jgi:WD40 repeat protein
MIKPKWSWKHSDEIWCIDVAQNGMVAVGTEDGKIFVFDSNGKQLWSYNVEERVGRIAISSDGEYVVAQTTKEVEVEKGFLFKKKETEYIKSIYMLRNGKYQWKHSFGYRERIEDMAMTPNGKYVFVAVKDYDTKKSFVYVFRRNGNLSNKIEVPYYTRKIAVTPDGEYIAVICNYGHELRLIKKDGEMLWSYKIEDYFSSVAISPDGRYVVAGGNYKDKHVYLFDRSGNLLWKYRTDGRVYSVDISSNGYVVAGSEDGEVYFFDTSGKLWSYETDGKVYEVKISIDGRYVIANADKCYFLDSSGNLIWSNRGYGTMSPDGRFVVVRRYDKIEFFDNSNLIGAKTCPYCHQKLPHELLKVCPYCFKDLPWADQIKDDTRIWGLDE